MSRSLTDNNLQDPVIFDKKQSTLGKVNFFPKETRGDIDRISAIHYMISYILDRTHKSVTRISFLSNSNYGICPVNFFQHT